MIQRIEAAAGLLDNVVELQLPRLPFTSDSEPQRSLRAVLGHSFTVSDKNSVRIVYEDTSAEPMSGGCVCMLKLVAGPCRSSVHDCL